jgi:fucose 4-O-acetylase-like acetyltransferase
MSINESKQITSLRFILTFLVVVLHAYGPQINFQGSTINLDLPKYVQNTEILFSNIIARSAVPMFFLFSGYLVCIKKENYFSNLKKKTKSILIPYLIWNSINILFYFVFQSIPGTRHFFSRENYLIQNFNFVDWIDAYSGVIERSPFPFFDLTWFLRDLFILNLVIPVINFLIKKWSSTFFVLVLLLWIRGDYILFLSSESLLFFSLGCFIGIKSSFEKISNNIRILDVSILYVSTLFIEIFFQDIFPVIHKTNIVIGVLFFWKMSEFLVKSTQLYKLLSFLSMYSFFIYFSHEPLMTILRKLSAQYIPANGFALFFTGYLLLIIVDLLFCLSIGMFLKHKFPSLFNLLTGGRAPKNEKRRIEKSNLL